MKYIISMFVIFIITIGILDSIRTIRMHARIRKEMDLSHNLLRFIAKNDFIMSNALLDELEDSLTQLTVIKYNDFPKLNWRRKSEITRTVDAIQVCREAWKRFLDIHKPNTILAEAVHNGAPYSIRKYIDPTKRYLVEVFGQKFQRSYLTDTVRTEQ